MLSTYLCFCIKFYVIFFIDWIQFSHQTETTHWDHPTMDDLMNCLSEYNEVRFSAYRMALKLRQVQKCLFCKFSYSLGQNICLYNLICIFSGSIGAQFGHWDFRCARSSRPERQGDRHPRYGYRTQISVRIHQQQLSIWHIFTARHRSVP